jgi:DNA-binding response OmpR family regulator
VIVVTAAPPSEWRTHLDGGVWGVLQKPFEISELEAALHACIGLPLAIARENAGDQLTKRVH